MIAKMLSCRAIPQQVSEKFRENSEPILLNATDLVRSCRSAAAGVRMTAAARCGW